MSSPQTPLAPPTFVKPGGGGAVPPIAGTTPPSRPPTPPAPRTFAIAALALALFAALILAEHPAGIGLALLGAGLAAALATLEVKRDRFSTACLAASALLAVVPAFRDSGWVTVLSLAGALTLASIAVASATTWREIAVATFHWIAQLVPAPLAVFSEGTRRVTGRKWGAAGPVLRGVALAAALVLVFGGLFASADEQFAQLLRDVFSWNLDARSIVARVFTFVAVLTVAGALYLVSTKSTPRPAREATGKLGRTEWLIALGALVTLFGGFVVLQLPKFFGGDDLIQLTDGLTYAGNARTGFGQLTVAAGLTLAVVAAAVHFGPAGDRIVQLLSGALCLLTIVVLASALHRLGLYTDAYGATRTRFSVNALLLWLGALLVLIVVAGAANRTQLLPRGVVALSAIFALGTVAVNPDGRIAERNVARYVETGHLDTEYLTSMSGDAVPSLDHLPPALRSCVARRFQVNLGARDPLQSLNLGRARARSKLTAFAPQRLGTNSDCWRFVH